MGNYKRDKYFDIGIRNPFKKRKSHKRKSSSVLGSSEGHDDTFWLVIGLTMSLAVGWAILFTFEATITSVKMFNILMTLGGLETYDQTVWGAGILYLICGLIVIFGFLDD